MMNVRTFPKPGRLLVALAVAASLAPASAQEPTHAPPPSAPETACIANDRFIVFSRSGDGPGNDIRARALTSRNATPPCVFDETTPDYRVAGTGEAKYALGLRRNFLILDEGTGPSLRWLRVVDLSARREVRRVQYVPEPAPALSRRGVIFSKYLRIARKNDCPNVVKITAQGLTPLYVIKGELSLPALTFRATGHPSCIAGQ